MAEPVLYALGFDGSGGGQQLAGDDITDWLRDDRLAWVHLDADNSGTRQWLQSNLDYLDPTVFEMLLAHDTRPRAEMIDDGLLLILRGVNLNPEARPEDMISVRLWIQKQRIVTLRKRRSKAISDIRAALEQGTGPKNAGDFVVSLTARLLERMTPSLNELKSELETIEDSVYMARQRDITAQLLHIARRAITFRRYLEPQKDAIIELTGAGPAWLDNSQLLSLSESRNTVNRYLEDLNAIKEKAKLLSDQISNILAEKMNRNMYKISIISAIFLPLGFITGLLGVNVAGIPGAEHPLAFGILGLFLVILVAIQIGLMKKSNWF